ncbi:WH1 domain containing protein [Aphelenchoides besseyi]|nr:WH1 domain containing protein [Aphelenchoides besseyi]
MLGAARRQPGGSAINAYDHGSTVGHRSQALQSTESKKRKERPENSGSHLLTRQENQLLFETLGPKRISLAAAVVQLLRASGGAWSHEHVGVVSLVKDYQRKEYALKLYDIYNAQMLWEQPLYKGFRAKSYSHCRKLLSFESDHCIYGLNFSDDEEAVNLKRHLEKRYEEESKNQKSTPMPNHQNITPYRPSPPHQSAQHQKFQSPGITEVGSVPPVSTQKIRRTKKKPKIRKEDIGLPTNFTHKVHVGWDVENGFCQEIHGDAPLDENVKQILQQAGSDPTRMSHEELVFARNFISDYRDQPGHSSSSSSSMNAGTVNPYATTSTLHRGNQSTQFHPPSSMTLTPQRGTGFSLMPGSVSAAPVPPLAPVRDSSMHTTTNYHSRGPPPSRPLPPSDMQRHPYADQQSKTTPSSNAPIAPPPPPPPMPSTNLTTSAPPAASNGRANLLAQIQAGKKLKHIDPPPERSPLGNVVGSTSTGNGRDQMMQQIKAGAQLKHVDQSDAENRKSTSNVSEIGGIAGALARALEERRKNINNTDESDNSDTNDSDWEDD